MKRGYTLISKACEGYTLIELLIVIAVFAIIGVITSETIILSLRGTKKADAISKVRTNLDFAVGEVERQIRGASAITSICDGSKQISISIVDQYKNPITFDCHNPNTNNLPSWIASSSAALTSSSVTISDCSFTCIPATTATPAQVIIDVTAQDASGQTAPVRDQTQITLRSQ